MKFFFIAACISAFLSVAIGAFGAHGLEGKVTERMMENWQTGVHYQMFHVIGLLTVAYVSQKVTGTSMTTWAGWMFIIGTVLFSGSLYTMALTNIKMLGAITPIGGIMFLVGWALLAITAFKNM
ncbi:MAG: DUF423 domain-containing protein [Bacillaceae bacterium]